MPILTIVNNKGGVGKTTTTQNLAAALSQLSHKRTLAIDLDPQGSLTKGFGIELQAGQPTTGSFLLGAATLADATIQQDLLHILPTHNALLRDEESLRSSPTFPFNLKIALDRDPTNYDYILIDCPPALSTLTKMALVACHQYYIPLQAEYFSYEGIREFVNYANEITHLNPQIELGGVFATRFNPRTNRRFSQEIVAQAKGSLQKAFLDTYIRECSDLYKAQAKGQHIFQYNKASNGAKDYDQLSQEILQKHGEFRA